MMAIAQGIMALVGFTGFVCVCIGAGMQFGDYSANMSDPQMQGERYQDFKKPVMAGKYLRFGLFFMATAFFLAIVIKHMS